jgi:hypothetical protein
MAPVNIIATITVNQNKNDIQKLKEYVNKLQKENNDKYFSFPLNCNTKLTCNKTQKINVIRYECYVLNNGSTKYTINDYLTNIHPCLGDKYIASKLSINFKRKNKNITLDTIFFDDLIQSFSQYNFDPICIKELEIMKEFWKPEDITRNIFNKSDSQFITFDISKHFASSFIKIVQKQN